MDGYKQKRMSLTLASVVKGAFGDPLLEQEFQEWIRAKKCAPHATNEMTRTMLNRQAHVTT